MAKVSIIVPVYNVESYLPQCLDSIVSQTLKDIEIILVNDGSSDSSGEICCNYAANDPRIQIINKENGGLASARNAGLDIAIGEYIGFVDSDDWLEFNMYERMYEVAVRYDCDIVFSNVYRDNDKKQQPYFRGGLYERTDIEENIFPRLLAVCDERTRVRVLRWSNALRVYRHSLIKKHNIRFDDRFRRCQDLPFTFECTINSRRYYYLDQDYLYHNRLNIKSLSRGYTYNMWSLIKPVVNCLNDVVRRYHRYDFSQQMDLRAFLFALECAENEVKVGNTNTLLQRLCIIGEIVRDPLVNKVLPKLNTKTMIPRTKVYYLAFCWKLPLLVYCVALFRYRHQRRLTSKLYNEVKHA